jgi:hypothetical protein
MANIVYISNDLNRLDALKSFLEKNGHTFTGVNSADTLVVVDAQAGQGAVSYSDQFDLAGWLAMNQASEPEKEPEVTIPPEVTVEPEPVDLKKDENEEACGCAGENEESSYGTCPECGEPGVGTERSIDGMNFCANHHRFPRPKAEENCEKAEHEEAEAVNIDQDGMVPSFSNVVVKRINDDQPIEALVDTGADLCSIDALNVETGENYAKFTFADKVYKVPLVRTVDIVATNGTETRPVVSFDIELDGASYKGVEFTLADRPEGTPKVLIGREFLAANDLLVQA